MLVRPLTLPEYARRVAPCARRRGPARRAGRAARARRRLPRRGRPPPRTRRRRSPRAAARRRAGARAFARAAAASSATRADASAICSGASAAADSASASRAARCGIGPVDPQRLEHRGVALAVAAGQLQRAGPQLTRLVADRVQPAERRRHLHEPGAERAAPSPRTRPPPGTGCARRARRARRAEAGRRSASRLKQADGVAVRVDVDVQRGGLRAEARHLHDVAAQRDQPAGAGVGADVADVDLEALRRAEQRRRRR